MGGLKSYPNLIHSKNGSYPHVIHTRWITCGLYVESMCIKKDKVFLDEMDKSNYNKNDVF